MKKILLLLTLSLFVNVALAQSTNATKEEGKTKQKISSEETTINKGCCSKKGTEKKCTSSEKSACAKKCTKSEKSCSKSSEKTACSKNKKEDASKCSKGDTCCAKTGKKRADCDKKDKGCCVGAK